MLLFIFSFSALMQIYLWQKHFGSFFTSFIVGSPILEQNIKIAPFVYFWNIYFFAAAFSAWIFHFTRINIFIKIFLNLAVAILIFIDIQKTIVIIFFIVHGIFLLGKKKNIGPVFLISGFAFFFLGASAIFYLNYHSEGGGLSFILNKIFRYIYSGYYSFSYALGNDISFNDYFPFYTFTELLTKTKIPPPFPFMPCENCANIYTIIGTYVLRFGGILGLFLFSLRILFIKTLMIIVKKTNLLILTPLILYFLAISSLSIFEDLMRLNLEARYFAYYILFALLYWLDRTFIKRQAPSYYEEIT